ncbi:MAG: endonuclease/exonuclease/phosphatase [Ferruginibacter sp.]|nr:endonuclease/exonuclease/phosphatase [Ferruginibacter sp.]
MNKSLYAAFIIIFLIFSNSLLAQKKDYRVSVVGFYNLENLFDTVNNPLKNDEEFLPNSARQYNTRIYYDKLDRLSDVISQMGTDVNPDGLAILGVAEVENDTVLKDLVKRPKLKDRKLKICHYDSPDARGIDVGMLYNPKYFSVLFSAPFFVQLPGGSKDAYFTRDVLYVKGLLDGDTMHVFVNHWPSRSGGEERSRPGREAAAQVVKDKVDSILAKSPNAKYIIMGDLNDDPISPSITKVLNAKGKKEDVKANGIYNPWVDMYKRGIGTSPYQDAWGLFDQIMVSNSMLDKNTGGYHFYKQMIFNKEFLVQKTGKYRNYSKRTWSGITYNYGYSDHFPVYIILLKEVQ